MRYKRLKLLGTGGFGEVWETESLATGEVFAVKFLRDGADDEARRRFAREVRVLSRMDHPNVVRVVDSELNAPTLWYAMPRYSSSLIDNLAGIVGDESRIRAVFLRILDAIEYSHAQGIIHRDLKPENILMNSDADLAVSDFGLVRDVDAKSTRQTRTGVGMGTFFYMAPEQLKDSKNVDARADVYSLGMMLFELYDGELQHPAIDPNKIPPSPGFIVKQATRQNPADRFQTVTALKQAWLSIFNQHSPASDLEELAQLRIGMTIPNGATPDAVKRFLELLLRYFDDKDLVHESVMQLHPTVVQEAYRQDSDAAKRILLAFAASCEAQGWPFGYTDKIGDQAQALYKAVSDPEAKAALLAMVVEVGTSHNRWHVLGIAADLLVSDHDVAEEMEIASRLEKLSPHSREGLKGHVKVARLSPRLQTLFSE